MPIPDYKRPFELADFRGYFTWDEALSEQLFSDHLYHACHLRELKDAIANEWLGLRSMWKLKLPGHGMWECPGVWCGLNYFHNGNRYGPFLMRFPLSVLHGRTFMVFRRIKGRRRYFFVQYESKLPVFSYKGNSWREVTAANYFDEGRSGQLVQKSGAIYDLILTSPVSMEQARLSGVSHQDCIPKKCSGMTMSNASRKLAAIAKRRFLAMLNDSTDYQKLVTRFPDLEYEDIELPGKVKA